MDFLQYIFGRTRNTELADIANPYPTYKAIVYNFAGYVFARSEDGKLIDSAAAGAKDAAIINAACNNVGSSGGNVLVKRGTYVVETAIAPPAGVRVIGEGVATVLQCKANTQINVVALANANSGIRNCKIDGNKANNTDAGNFANQNGVYCTVSACDMADLTIENTEQSGITCSGNGVDNEFVQNCRIAGAGASGILFIGGVSNSDIIGCRITDCAHVGVRLETTSSGNRVNNCYVKGCTYGFLANQCEDNVFSNCTADDNDLTNLGAIYSVGFYNTNSVRIVFIGCTSKNNAGIGFHTEAASAHFIGCVAKDNGRHGFGSLDDTKGSLYVACRAYNNGRLTIAALERSGFGLQGARNCIISGCIAYDDDATTQILSVREEDSLGTTSGDNLIIGCNFKGYAGNPDPGISITGTLAGSKTQWHYQMAFDAIANIVVGASAFNYQNTDYHDIDVIVSGGTVTNIEYSRDGATYYSTGLTAGKFRLATKEYLRVTYSAAPTMTKVPY